MTIRSRQVVVWFAPLITVLLLLPIASGSQTTSTDIETQSPAASPPGGATKDTSFVLSPGSDEPPRFDPFQTNTARPLSMYLARNTRLMFGYETYRLSRLECAIKGADVGLTLGLAVGALGMTTGVWDERTSWYLAGAMTALGALLGGSTKTDDPRRNLHLRWQPDR